MSFVRTSQQAADAFVGEVDGDAQAGVLDEPALSRREFFACGRVETDSGRLHLNRPRVRKCAVVRARKGM